MNEIIVLAFILLTIGFVVYKKITKKKKNGSSNNLPNFLKGKTPTKLRGFSFHYVPFKWDWKPFVDLFAEYKVNHTRIFTMGHPSWGDDKADWYPWKGGWNDPVDNLDEDKINQVIEFVRHCCSKGIWVHVDPWTAQYRRLPDDWLAGGERKERVKRYMFQLISRLKEAVDDSVIIGMGNELSDKDTGVLGRQLFDEVIVKLPTHTWTAGYHSHERPWRYVTMHELCDEHHCHEGVTSNDSPPVIEDLFMRHHIYKNIMTNVMRCPAEREGFEWLTLWGKNGKCDTPEKVKAEWGDLLEHNKNL